MQNKFAKDYGSIAAFLKQNLPSAKDIHKDKHKALKVLDDGAIADDNKFRKGSMDYNRRFSDFERMCFSFYSQLIQIANQNLKNTAKLTRICSALITAFNRRHNFYEDDVKVVGRDAARASSMNNALRNLGHTGYNNHR